MRPIGGAAHVLAIGSIHMALGQLLQFLHPLSETGFTRLGIHVPTYPSENVVDGDPMCQIQLSLPPLPLGAGRKSTSSTHLPTPNFTAQTDIPKISGSRCSCVHSTFESSRRPNWAIRGDALKLAIVRSPFVVTSRMSLPCGVSDPFKMQLPWVSRPSLDNSAYASNWHAEWGFV